MLRRNLAELNLCLIQHLLHITHKHRHTFFFSFLNPAAYIDWRHEWPTTITNDLVIVKQKPEAGNAVEIECYSRASFDFNDTSIYVNQF